MCVQHLSFYWSLIDLFVSLLYVRSIAGPDYNLPPRERVAKWQLQQLDTNRNNVIDRQETRELRLLFKRSQKLRRCSKKLPAFCDTNGDKRITADEWLQCVGVVKGIDFFPLAMHYLPLERSFHAEQFWKLTELIFISSRSQQHRVSHYSDWRVVGRETKRAQPIEHLP